ncbi:hypothetical protein FRB99_002266 [Tulasnella sp. 403]|nr:hypothetical protein FRB99_002266 [Tulasnella sp. 403]
MNHDMMDMGGMDMDGMGDVGGGGGGMMMMPYFHFRPSDALWFKAWQPTSNGAIVGACIGLFLLAVVERMVSGMQGVMELWWRRKTEAILVRRLQRQPSPRMSSSLEKTGITGADDEQNAPPPVTIRRVLPPFILSHDLTRAAVRVFHAAIGYALMLAVMQVSSVTYRPRERF